MNTNLEQKLSGIHIIGDKAARFVESPNIENYFSTEIYVGDSAIHAYFKPEDLSELALELNIPVSAKIDDKKYVEKVFASTLSETAAKEASSKIQYT